MNQVVVATTKIDIFKQITTRLPQVQKPTHVVVATTKINLFKQITTSCSFYYKIIVLLLPQKDMMWQAKIGLYRKAYAAHTRYLLIIFF